MSQEYIEITERTVSEAITAACQKLSVPSERLEYEVIDPGKAGFLGIGARAAKIRARVKKGMEESPEFDASAIISDVLSGRADKIEKDKEKEKEKAAAREREQKEAGEKREKKEKKERRESRASGANEENRLKKELPEEEKLVEDGGREDLKEERDRRERKLSDGAGAEKRRPKEKTAGGPARAGREFRDFSQREDRRGHRRKSRFDRDESGSVDQEHVATGRRESRTDRQDRDVQGKRQYEYHAPQRRHSTAPSLTDEQVEEIRRRADTFLSDVFNAMDLEAEVESSYDRENGILTLDMKGDNMGVLIGKRGQTLDSLQYLVSLVVNKGIEGYIHVKADTENYRERRKRTLENLAKNIAARVKRGHASVALEPMNPYERRIIHSALQGDRYVTTYSEGEEPYRKVIVTLKEERQE